MFTLLLGLAAAAYIRAAATDPGSVACNTADEPQMPNYENLVALIKAGNVSDDELSAACLPRRRYCDKCKVIKPPRAHHCSTCGRCIQKMDHHCPWVCVRATHARACARMCACGVPLASSSVRRTTCRSPCVACPAWRVHDMRPRARTCTRVGVRSCRTAGCRGLMALQHALPLAHSCHTHGACR
ncbi:hypothetical protein EON67_08870 [archaeon]|nr:MAG: hypothetical protein EON67_08870 [archaeon]